MKRSGFTLIEVMIATVILLLMTVMMGALFRQASSAWDAGNAQAEGGMIVRGVVGAITRDMATAIDGRAYGEPAFTCDGTTLSFVSLKPTVHNGVTNREPHLITYSGGSRVERTDKVRKGSGWVNYGSKSKSIIYDGDAKGYSARFSFVAIDRPSSNLTNPSSSSSRRDGGGYEGLAGSSDYAWSGPAAVKVRLTLIQDGTFSGLRVCSWGPDGIEGSKEGEEDDDIVVR